MGLAGELRRVPNLDRRLSEAARLGYENAIVPAGKVDAAGIRVLQAGTLGEAIALLR